MRLSITLLLLFVSLNASACRPSLNGILWDMENAVDVHVGRVTGFRNVSFENLLEEDGDSKVIQIPSRYKMRVFITQTLMGKAKKVVEANSTLCKEHYSIREKVFVFSNSKEEYTFAISEDDLKANFVDIFKQFSNQSKQ